MPEPSGASGLMHLKGSLVDGRSTSADFWQKKVYRNGMISLPVENSTNSLPISQIQHEAQG